MAIALRAAGTGAGSASSTTSVAFTLPAGTTTGDLCLYALKVGNTAQTISKTGGTGTWTIWSQASDSTNVYTWMFGAYVLQAGDTAPTFGWATASNTAWSCTALKSTTGAVLSVDAWATELEQQTTVASVTPNAATAAGAGEASVVLILNRTSGTVAATSYTWTPPSGWTQDATGSFLPNAFRGAFSGTCYQLGMGPGSVAPGSMSLTDTAGDTFFWSVAHALVAETPAGAVTSAPQRYGQAAPPGYAPWSQPLRQLAYLTATPANPLPAPLDVAWGAGGGYSHLYSDTAARDRRACFTQRNYVSDPALLASVNADPLQRPQAQPWTRPGPWPQQRPLTSDPNLLVPAHGSPWTFDDGSTQGWTPVTAGAGTATITAGAAHDGAFGAQSSVPAASVDFACLRLNITPAQTASITAWWRVTTEGASSSSNVPFARFFSGGNRLADVYRQNTSGVVWLRIVQSAGVPNYTFISTGQVLAVGTWTQVTFSWSLNGNPVVILDGVQYIGASSNQANIFAAPSIDTVYLGSVEAGNQGVWNTDTVQIPGLLEAELLGGASTAMRQAWTRPGSWPAQRPLVSDPNLLTPALLENELLGGAETGKYCRTPVTHAPRWWMPQQPARLADPLLIGTAELENELLGGADTARHWLSAAYWDRRLVPQQRAYISDPSLYQSGAVTDPLAIAWGAGGPYWHLYNRAADITDRREYPYQRPYVSDLLLLAQALLENELLGGAETGKVYRTPATHVARWWMPQQRLYLGVDLTTALLENELLGGAGAVMRYAPAYYDRREVPQQRAYISDPSFYSSIPPGDPLTLAWGAGGVYWHLYNQPADITDRREYPQQRNYVSDPLLTATALLEGVLLGGGQTGAYYRVPASHAPRWWAPEQRAYVSDPFLLATAELENELLGGAETPKTYRTPVTHYDRREVPAQRAYYALPQLFLDPVQSAWASLQLAYNMPATHADRRLVPQQKDMRDANMVAVPPPAVIKGFSTAYGVTEPMLSSGTTGKTASSASSVTQPQAGSSGVS